MEVACDGRQWIATDSYANNMDKDNNYTFYEPLQFTVTVDKLEFDPNTHFVVKSDFGALMHEWWHYFQDISTVTGQNGVYMWLRDMARISKITCQKEGAVIHVPLSRDEYGEPMSKFLKLYLLFCGKKEEVWISDAHVTSDPTINAFSLPLEGATRTLQDCKVYINGNEYQFRLIALQELNCFYAQKIAEGFVDEKPKVAAASLPEFPYKVGDLLFEHYHIDCDDRVKFLISSLCLDSIQAPAVFLKMLETMKGQSISFESDIDSIEAMFDQVSNECACPNDVIYKEWMKDYGKWAFDNGRQFLSKAIEWFVNKIHLCYSLRLSQGKSVFVKSFCESISSLNKLYLYFPIPIFKRKCELLGSSMKIDNNIIDFGNEHEQALILRYHKRFFDLLCVKEGRDLNDLAECDIYDNCPYRDKVGKDYECKRAVWEVVKGEKQAKCPYAIALHSMGLWQNKLVVDI